MDFHKPIKVNRKRNLDVTEFESDFLVPQCPVIIEDHLSDLPHSKWTINYLLQRVSDNKINVRGRTDQEDYRVGKTYTLRTTTFGEYVTDMKKANTRGVSSYMAVQNIGKVFPEIASECKMPKYVKKIHNGPFLWVAHSGHYEFCHFDSSEGMLMMISGTKRIRLYKNSDIDNLYPNPLGSKGKTIQSQVDCEKPDTVKHPNFSKAQCFTCVLREGEMLYIPAFWWHQVTSETDAVSVNVFFGDEGSNSFVTRHLTSPSWPAFKYWLLNVIEQNRPYDSFTRTLERLSLCVENLLLKQFHEIATPEQLEFLLQTVMNHIGITKLPEFTNGGKHPPMLKIRGLRWR